MSMGEIALEVYKSIHVLIIDDDDQIRTMLRQMFEKEGFEVTDAPNGIEGMRLHNEKSADIVITDFIKPVNEGIETIAKTPVLDEAGGAVGILRSVRDITKRKQAEEAPRESEEKYRSIMEAMKAAVYICSPNLRIEYMNPAMINRTGHNATGELCHKAIYDNDEKCSWCVFDQVQQGEHVECEVDDTKNNKYYSTSNSLIHHPDGSISKLTISRYITQVKKTEDQLRQALKMEAIGTLAGGIAHKFNNALSVITGNIDLLEMDVPNNKIVSNYTQKMKSSADHMTKLTAQLLAYARGGKYQAETISINEFVKNTLPLLQHSIDLSIKVETNLATDILNVNADSTQMQMVLSAILANASEAIEGEGLIRISTKGEEIDDEFVKHYPDLKPGPYVCLTVEDDGKGMDEETKSKIFEPFFTTKFQGRGLGMAAVYGIVKNHDGWVSVYSEIGRGTVVRIYLPAIESQIKKPEKPKVKLPKDAGTILLIEDEEKVMGVSRALSERLGYRVLGAMNGEEAVSIAKSYDGDIDLAILDIILPDIEGKEVYPQLKEVSPNLKVIVCSGYSIDGPAQEVLDAGAQDFIQKPFTLTALSEKLKKALVAK